MLNKKHGGVKGWLQLLSDLCDGKPGEERGFQWGLSRLDLRWALFTSKKGYEQADGAPRPVRAGPDRDGLPTSRI